MERRRCDVVEVRVYARTAQDLSRRAERRLLAARRAAVADEVAEWVDGERHSFKIHVHEDDCPFYPLRIEDDERQRLQKFASKLVAKRLPATPIPAKIVKEDKDMLIELARSSFEVVASVCEVDEVFSQLHEESPWLGRLTEVAWRQARLWAEEGLPVHAGRLVVLGPPGGGKSTWARRLAELFGLPAVEVDVGATGGAFETQGSDHRWGNGAPGRLVQTLIATRIANPIVIMDELDKGSRSVSTTGGGSLAGLFSALLGMLEPSTCGRWTCPFYSLNFNLRSVSWIMTTNSLEGIPAALLSRIRVVELDPLSETDLWKFSFMMGRKMGLDDDVIERCAWMLRWRMRDGRPTDLRTASRALELARERIKRPQLN